jgi:hypothetical protein
VPIADVGAIEAKDDVVTRGGWLTGGCGSGAQQSFPDAYRAVSDGTGVGRRRERQDLTEERGHLAKRHQRREFRREVQQFRRNAHSAREQRRHGRWRVGAASACVKPPHLHRHVAEHRAKGRPVMALGGLRRPAPQTVPGDHAVAFDLIHDNPRLDRRQYRLAFGDTQPQRGRRDSVIAVDGHDFVLDLLSWLEFRHQRDRPAHRCSFRGQAAAEHTAPPVRTG